MGSRKAAVPDNRRQQANLHSGEQQPAVWSVLIPPIPPSLRPRSSPLGNPQPSTFDPCLQGSSDTANFAKPHKLCKGDRPPTCRNRTVGCVPTGPLSATIHAGSNSDCTTSPYTTCTKNVWKLGDIVYSTPQVQTDYKYCSNGSSFSSQSCSQDSDCTSGAYTSCQKKESVVFVGANDGMLHAFKTGILTHPGNGPIKTPGRNIDGDSDLGHGQGIVGLHSQEQSSLPEVSCSSASKQLPSLLQRFEPIHNDNGFKRGVKDGPDRRDETRGRRPWLPPAITASTVPGYPTDRHAHRTRTARRPRIIRAVPALIIISTLHRTHVHR